VRRGALGVAQLRARLERLRDSCQYLQTHAGLGRELRQAISEAGSPVWRPAEDLRWREWIERQGDEYAQGLLAAIDELLEERAAELEAAGELERRSRAPAQETPS